MKTTLIGIAIIFIVVLQYALWFKPGGVSDLVRLKKQVAVLQNQNTALQNRNQALSAQITDLKENNDAIEARARSELGMVKQGESFYQIVPDSNKPSQTHQTDY